MFAAGLVGLFAVGSGTLPARAADPPAPVRAATPEDLEQFEKQVRPLLVQECFACHSDKGKPGGKLRLDSLAAIRTGGLRGPAIQPGDPENSLLVQVVDHTAKGLKMPPGKKLPPEKIAVLAEWIRRGAHWPGMEKAPVPAGPKGPTIAQRAARHWAYRPLQPPALPPVRNTGWVRSPVDRFLLARLEKAGLPPSPPADRATLLRRVTYDLTGLPPTPEELAAFLNDPAPDAYEKVVDRLLASPAYGERQARFWMDLVRYAETDGHEFDFEKPGAYLYRDYLIRAFNADVPYDQFVREHIAGDLLPQPRRNPENGWNESLIGTTFWWLGEGKHSPVDLIEDQAERVDNQIDVFSKTFVGQSMGCARCHDHKFDAITQKDYFGLYGILQSTRYHVADVTDPEPARKAADRLRQLQARMEPLVARGLERSMGPRLAAGPAPAARLAGLGGGQDAGNLLPLPVREAAAKDPLDPLHPLVVLGPLPAERYAAARDELLSRLRSRRENYDRAVKAAEVYADFDGPRYAPWQTAGAAFEAGPTSAPSLRLVGGGPAAEGIVPAGVAHSGRLSDRLQGSLCSPDFTIRKGRIHLLMSGASSTVNLVMEDFHRIRDPIYGRLTFQVSTPASRPRWYTFDIAKWIGHNAYLEVLDHGAGYAAVHQVLFSDGPAPGEAPEPWILELLSDPTIADGPALEEAYRRRFAQALADWRSGEQPAAVGVLNALLRTGTEQPSASSGEDLASLLAERRRVEESIPPAVRTMAATEGTPADEQVHIRGSHKARGDRVPRRYLEALSGSRQPPIRTGSGRAELADRLLRDSRGLVARVIVNRIWRQHFTEGIVRTPDDFGVRGEPPTHPELLEWLAAVFARPLHKEPIPNSYALGWSLKRLHRVLVLSSAYRQSSKTRPAVDAKDPQNRLLHRMHVRRLEGEAIRDGLLAVSGRLDRTMYGPGVLPHLTAFLEGRGRPAQSGPLDGAGRRSIYLQVRRNFLNPFFLAFDTPIPFTTIGRRSVSTVPAQALALMNNPFVLEQAGVWAKRVLSEPALTPEQRVERMYLAAFCRPPSPAEKQAAVGFVTQQAGRYESDGELRAWSDLCHVLINTKEFIFVH